MLRRHPLPPDRGSRSPGRGSGSGPERATPGSDARFTLAGQAAELLAQRPPFELQACRAHRRPGYRAPAGPVPASRAAAGRRRPRWFRRRPGSTGGRPPSGRSAGCLRERAESAFLRDRQQAAHRATQSQAYPRRQALPDRGHPRPDRGEGRRRHLDPTAPGRLDGHPSGRLLPAQQRDRLGRRRPVAHLHHPHRRSRPSSAP